MKIYSYQAQKLQIRTIFCPKKALFDFFLIYPVALWIKYAVPITFRPYTY